MQIPWLFLTLSTVVTFATLLLLVRWIGSTQLTQLTYFNWVAGASMGNIAATMMTATTMTNWISAFYSLVVFTVATILAAFIALKSRTFRRVTNGAPVVLIHKGALLRDNLRKTKVNLDVLMMLLREKGYFEYGAIEYGILEPTGNLSILPEQAFQSASKYDLVHGPDLSGRGQGPYLELILDGEIDKENLKRLGRDERWLTGEIQSRGAKDISHVLLFAVNKEGDAVMNLFHPKR